MKGKLTKLLITLTALLSIQFSIAQDYSGKIEKRDGKLFINGLPLIADEDLEAFKDLPQLTLTEAAKSRVLPVEVDNSDLPYFRPIFDQVALECGQASGVAYTFTYEINRLRDLPANVIENQYPTHFVYNWSGMGSGQASSFFDSWNIIKYAGTPNVEEYGGSLNYGGSARWISGYDVYYSAMHNRLWDYYSIDVTTEDGLIILKHWIANHLNGEETGGVGNVYTAAIGSNLILPPGTPEAGKHVMLELATYANHALCVVGYHDSIRYDINNDGQYTNDLDINNDGEVNILDWEMGGVKLANSYYASSWGDAGFSYLLYSGLCRKMNPQGGPWNGMVHVIKAKENTEPQATFKVKLTHDSRNKIKVMAGVATTPGATEPEFIIDFPILNYQGGDHYMTGGSGAGDKTLDFGLDVTPLLSHIASGGDARFFLLIDENDPSNNGTGMVDNFSLMDYTFGTTEFPCLQSNVPITENGLTTLWVDADINFEKPDVLNDELPAAIVNEPYQHQMVGTNGTPPYQWKLQQKYNVLQGSMDFPMISDEQLTPTSQTSGYATKEIDFEFPYFGKTYNKVYLHTDGYLMFKGDNYPWTFLIDQKNLFKNMCNIAPMMSNTLQVQGGGSMWYQGNSTKATFRWDSKEYGTNNTQNFALSLYPDGTIELYYGECAIAGYNSWYAGVSEGDDFNCQILDISNTQVAPNTMITLEPDYSFVEMEITENGLFKGTPTQPYEAIDVDFFVKDANGLQNTKSLIFSTDGVNDVVIREVTVQSGDNSIIEYGETAILTLELKNISENIVAASEMMIACADQYISLTDSLASLEAFAPGETKLIENAFAFEVSNAVPNAHNIVISSSIEAGTNVYASQIYLAAFAPNLAIGSGWFEDGNNGHAEPGETLQVFVKVKNTGGGKAFNVETELTLNDPFITITNGSYTISSINGGSIGTAEFEIYIEEDAPLGYATNFNINATADNNYAASGTLDISVGFISEDFESGDFSMYEWEFSGDTTWLIDDFDPYEGAYCMKSGDIDDDETSIISISMDILLDGEIGFYYAVSSETSYDYLRFYVDDVMQGEWAGELGWGYASFPVLTGEHTFTWAYEKDYSVSNGFDCAFVDYIIFPPSGQMEMAVSAGPDLSICEDQSANTQAYIINAQSLEWSTAGDGTFDNNTLVNPEYFPGTDDIFYGTVNLTVTAWDYQGSSQSDNASLFIHHLPIMDAGDDIESCENISPIGVSGVAVNTESVFWETTGDGTFAFPSLPNNQYYPGDEDLSNGQVVLVFNAFALAPCSGISSDALSLTFLPLPEVNFDSLPLLGLNSPPYQLTEGSPEGGIYSGPGVSDGWLYPVLAGIGTHTLTYTYFDTNDCWDLAHRDVTIDEYVGLDALTSGADIFTIVPNPGDGLFYVYPGKDFNADLTATVFNASGQKMRSDNFTAAEASSKLKIDCSNYQAGVYYLHLSTDQNKWVRKLIIK